MKKNAFTMIEVMAIIALLGVILVITLPKLFSSNEQSKITERDKLIEMIVNAGSLYLINNQKPIGSSVPLTTLCAQDFIKCPINNPVTKTNFNGTVTSSLDANGILKYTYVEA